MAENTPRLSFTCDYEEGAHPAILKRLAETNFLKEPGYGYDEFSLAAKDKIREACGVFRYNKPAWKKLMVQGMESDFSWDSSADRYIEVYHTALGW